MIHTIQSFYRHYVKVEDRIMLCMMALAMVTSLVMVLCNALGAQYVGNSFFPFRQLITLPLVLMLFFVALYARALSPRWSLFAWAMSMIMFMRWVTGVLIYGVQLAPFQTIDLWLTKIDQRMVFDQLQWLSFAHRYDGLARGLDVLYSTLLDQLWLVPLLVAGLGWARSIRVLYMAMMCSMVVGGLIYYFFPSAAPASVFDSPYFTWQQKNTFVKFYELRHGLPNTATQGGLIAFPSFHVVWSVLFVYACKDNKYLLLLMALIDTGVILSTILLGWHYLIDVIGGVGLAVMAILFAEWLDRRYVGSAVSC